MPFPASFACSLACLFAYGVGCAVCAALGANLHIAHYVQLIYILIQSCSFTYSLTCRLHSFPSHLHIHRTFAYCLSCTAHLHINQPAFYTHFHLICIPTYHLHITALCRAIYILNNPLLLIYIFINPPLCSFAYPLNICRTLVYVQLIYILINPLFKLFSSHLHIHITFACRFCTAHLHINLSILLISISFAYPHLYIYLHLSDLHKCQLICIKCYFLLLPHLHIAHLNIVHLHTHALSHGGGAWPQIWGILSQNLGAFVPNFEGFCPKFWGILPQILRNFVLNLENFSQKILGDFIKIFEKFSPHFWDFFPPNFEEFCHKFKGIFWKKPRNFIPNLENFL